MNKGFILDGYPKTIKDAKTVFMDRKLEADEEETKPSPTDSTTDLCALELSTKIVP